MGMCKGCGKVFSAEEIKDGYCKDCLPKINKGSKSNTDDYEQAMIEAFVGKPDKFSWYKKAFSQFSVNGISTMKWNWSWWAFFGTCWFLIYRKAYLSGLVVFILFVITSWIPLTGLIISILTGGYSTYFVYKIYKVKKDEIEKSIDDEQKRIETMKIVGGYNNWVVWLAIILNGLIIVGLLAAVALPRLANT